jgi:hypothetical protein
VGSPSKSPNSRQSPCHWLKISALHAPLPPLTLSFLHWLKSNTSRSAPKLLTSFAYSTHPSPSRTYRSGISKARYLTSQSEGLATMAGRKPGVIALFDVDGTLTAPRKVFDLSCFVRL